MRRRAARRLAPALLVLLATACERREMAPNLLLVTIDTLRADVLGCYGDPDGHTPALDGLAARGAVFENALAPMATTFPSHASMFTGFYPRRHGVRWNGDALGEEWVTLAEILRDAGYATAAFVSYKDMVHRGGLGQGFDALSPAAQRPGPVSRPGEETNQLADAWLQQHADRPFFLWVHYFEPHPPYLLTPYAAQRLPDGAGVLADGASIEELQSLRMLPEELAALRVLYEGRVREADARLAELLAGLEAAGVAQRTLVAVLADHGEQLGEDGHVGHGLTLAEASLRIPFVIVDPRLAGAARISERVGAIDLAPTLLDLLGFELPQGLQGRSLAPALRGESLSSAVYFAETRDLKAHERMRSVLPKWASALAVYEGAHKLVLQPGRSELFDVSSGRAERAAPDAVLHGRLEEQGRSYRRLGAPAAAEAPLDAQLVEELRSLGYIE